LSFTIHLAAKQDPPAGDSDGIRCPAQTPILQSFFSRFRSNTIGHQQTFESPFGKKEILYADWAASGRAYRPIEEYMQTAILPFVANTHTETTVTGTLMSKAYEEAKFIIKEHVRANTEDVLVFCGSGTTAAVNKLQRILGLRIPERLRDYVQKAELANPGTAHAGVVCEDVCAHLQLDEDSRPVVFVTHMEHHSNQVSWLETIATVEIIKAGENGNVDLVHFRSLLEQFAHRKNKIAAITACSNVTGIETPYYEIAKLVHEYGGLCFVDFGCSAPYIQIDMHAGKGMDLDAIFFSPHKFLGGPGTPGVLVFNKKIYTNSIPDQPGGGTLVYSNPWKEHEYTTDIEHREDGGTPPILQAIKAAMCVRLKEEMGIENIRNREEEIVRIIFDRFSTIKNIEVLEGGIKNRLGVISFIVHDANHNLVVKLLNDRFGIQTRGGCSCAGTYGHLLLQVDEATSHEIWSSIRAGDLSRKPGWIRLSIHPTMSNTEIDFIMEAIELTAAYFPLWMKDYDYDPASNEYTFRGNENKGENDIEEWFTVSSWD